MEFNQADINSIFNAKENDNLVVFIGAGFSKFSNSNTVQFPNWGELIDGFKEDLGISGDGYDYLKIAQLYYLRYGEYRLYEKLKISIPLNAEPSELHRIVFNLNPKYVVTTNWDNLLEKTVEENGLIYDIVKSDADLVKSTIPRKVVKIHGSLDSHNIVFKEDDYLNFSSNSPLLENFIKHILSTSTVLFLGYSYSDSNLKMLSKWIEKQASSSPPRFLLSVYNNEIDALYYKNHGIKVISPEDVGKKFEYSDVHNNFLKGLERKNTIANSLKNIIDKDIDNLTNNEKLKIIDYFYNNLHKLSEFRALLPEQITSILTNSSVEYHKNCFAIWLHQGVLTTDYDEDVRKIYILFFNMLYLERHSKKLKNTREIWDKLKSIFRVFLLANIQFIRCDFNSQSQFFEIMSFIKNNNEELDLFEIFEDYQDFLRFNDSDIQDRIILNSSFDSENKKKLEELLNKYNDEVNRDLKKNQYYKAVIDMFNKDYVSDKLQLCIASIDRKNLSFIENHTDWEKKINYFPSEIQDNITILQSFLNFKSIYKFHYEATVDSRMLISRENSIRNGGFGFSINDERSNSRCIQILKFTVCNQILIDDYTEFKELMNSYVTSKIEVQSIKRIVSLYDHDLFILIRYFSYKELSKILKTLILKEDDEKERLAIVFNNDEAIYLLDVFNNITKLYKYNHTSIYETLLSKSYCNVLLVLSLVQWSDTQYEEIVDTVLSVFTEFQMPYDAYKALDSFILLNFTLYSREYIGISRILDIPLKKLLNSQSSSFLDYFAIKNDFINAFGYHAKCGVLYSNKSLIEQVIDKLKKSSDEQNQRVICRDFICKYSEISDDETKAIIEEYISNIRKNSWENNEYDEIITELFFNDIGYPVNSNFTSFLSNWIDDYLTQEVLTSDPYVSTQGMANLDGWFEHLAKNRNLKEYKELHNKMLTKYDEFNKLN